MDKRRGLITKYNEKIDRANDEIKECFVEIGRQLNNFPLKSFTKTPLSTLSRDARKIQSSIENYDRQIQRIADILQRNEEMKQERQALNANIDSIENENIPVYAKIGEEAFRIYKETPAQFHEYAEIFSTVMEQKNELIQMERDIAALDSEQQQKGFFGKIVDKGQATYLRGRKLVRMKSLSKYYEQIGEKVCNSDFIEQAESQSLHAVAKPYYDNMQRREELNDQLKQLIEEQEKLDQELIDLTGEQKAGRRMDELRIAAKDEKNNLLGIFERMGITYYKAAREEMESNEKIDQNVERIEELEKNIETSKKVIERVEADIEAEKLSADIQRMERNITSLEEDIARSQERIAQLKDEIESTEKEKAKYEKIRGPKEQLPVD